MNTPITIVALFEGRWLTACRMVNGWYRVYEHGTWLACVKSHVFRTQGVVILKRLA